MELKKVLAICLISISIDSIITTNIDNNIYKNESFDFELSKSKHIIYSHGNKVIYENRTTKIQQTSKKKISTTTSIKSTTASAAIITNENFMKLSQLLENETFCIENVTSNKTRHNVIIKFSNYSINFINLLNQLNVNRIQIQIRQFSKQGYIFQLKTNLSAYYILNITNKDEYNSISYYFKRTTNDQNYLLDSVMLSKMKRYGFFIICIQFLDSNGKIIYLPFNSNNCYDWNHELKDHKSGGEEIGFQYKPLFIVIMYFMCASILIPIAVWQHFINKFKLEKKNLNKPKLNLINEKNKLNHVDSDTTKSLKNAGSSDILISKLNNHNLNNNSQELEPLIDVNTKLYSGMKFKKSVLFDLETSHSEKENSDEDEDESDENELSKSVNHILDQKPWLSQEFYSNNNNGSLDHLNIDVNNQRAASDLNLNSKYYRGTKYLREKSIKLKNPNLSNLKNNGICIDNSAGGSSGSILKKSVSNTKINMNKEINIVITKSISNKSLSTKTAVYYESNV